MRTSRTIVATVAAGSRPLGAFGLLGALFILLLPFSAVQIAPAAGDLGMNLGLPLLAPLLLALFLQPAPFPLFGRIEDPYQRLVRAVFWFFLWSAFTTVLTGILFEYSNIEAYGMTPFAYSLPRAPIPLIIGAVVVVSFMLASRALPPLTLERLLIASAMALTLYGCVQIYARAVAPDWYPPLAAWLEAGRNRTGGSPIDYVTFSGRLNLTTYEAAEAARLLLIVYIPVVLTPVVPGADRLLRAALLVSMILIIAIAQTIVGIVGLATLLAVWILLLLRRHRLASILVLAGVAAIVVPLLPEEFTERVASMMQNQDAEHLDPSLVTRAALAVASLQVSIEHPFWGIGWSKDIFFLGDAIPEWGYTWELQQYLLLGEAISAKSLVLRLLLYAGFPALLLLASIYVRTFLAAIRCAMRERHPLAIRAALVLATFVVCGVLDGGFVSAFYSWAALGLALGAASRSASVW